MRIFIEDYTGVPSGSVYRDRILPRSGEGIVVKTHRLDCDRYDRAIHIVRHPLDAIESYFHWRRDVLGQDPAWESHVPRAARLWAAHSRHWTGASYSVFRLRYEDMVADPHDAFAGVLAYLGVVVDEGHLEAALAGTSIDRLRARFPEIGDRFFGRGTVDRGADRYTADQIRLVRRTCRRYMRRWGYMQGDG